MTLRIEQISDTKIWIHDGSTNIMEIDTSAGVRINSALRIGANALTGTVLTDAVAGIGQSYKVARGMHTTLDENDTVVTGLATVVAVVATLDSDPVAGAQFVTASIGDQAGAPAAGSVLIKTWKATAAGDTALIAASTFTKLVNWIAIGT